MLVLDACHGDQRKSMWWLDELASSCGGGATKLDRRKGMSGGSRSTDSRLEAIGDLLADWAVGQGVGPAAHAVGVQIADWRQSADSWPISSNRRVDSR